MPQFQVCSLKQYAISFLKLVHCFDMCAWSRENPDGCAATAERCIHCLYLVNSV